MFCWKNVSSVIQLQNLMIQRNSREHVIEAFTKLLNPSPSGHQPLFGSSNDKKYQTGHLVSFLKVSLFKALSTIFFLELPF